MNSCLCVAAEIVEPASADPPRMQTVRGTAVYLPKSCVIETPPFVSKAILDVDFPLSVRADTNRVVSLAEAAREFDAFTQEATSESVPLGFNPDDYPLF